MRRPLITSGLRISTTKSPENSGAHKVAAELPVFRWSLAVSKLLRSSVTFGVQRETSCGMHLVRIPIPQCAAFVLVGG